MTVEELKTSVMRIMDQEMPSRERLQAVCDLLKSQRKLYDWVGFYLVDRKKQNELVLGPFAGQPTDHTRIGFGEGICGQAASTLEVFVIDDVSAESNYLSCSPSVQSEFVAPVIWRNELVGELDLDSHTAAAFSDSDSEFLLWVAGVTAGEVAGAAGFDQ